MVEFEVWCVWGWSSLGLGEFKVGRASGWVILRLVEFEVGWVSVALLMRTCAAWSDPNYRLSHLRLDEF